MNWTHKASGKSFVSLAEIIYYCYFAVMLGAKAIGLYEGQLAYNVCLVIGAGLFACKLLTTKHTIKELLMIILFISLGGIVYLQSGEKSLLIYFTMMLGVKDVPLERVFKVGGLIWLISFVSLYVLAVIGVIPEYSYTLLRTGWPIILRHSLGYPHPNTLHASFFVLVAFILYISRELPKKYITAITIALFFGNAYVFMYSVSRNGFFVVCIYLCLNTYLCWRDNRSKFEDAVLMSVIPVSVISIVVCPLILRGEVYDFFNTIFAGRFEFTHYYLTYRSLGLFGIREIPVPKPGYVLDSSYVYLLFRLGLASFFVVIGLMLLTTYNAIKNNRNAEIALLLSFSLYGILEQLLFNQSYKNLTFLFMGAYLFKIIVRHEEKGFALIDGSSFGVVFDEKEHERNPFTPLNIWLFTFLIFIIIGIVTSILYAVIVPYPSDIYIPYSEECTSGNGIETYLSEEDVKQMRKEGIIIRGYENATIPLYKMRNKSVAKMERIRYTVSYGLWAGTIACIAFLLYWTTKSRIRSLTRNKQIGKDYKEKVLIVHNYYRIPGGEDVVVANEKRMLEEHGHEVITYFKNNDDARDAKSLGKIGLAFTALFSLGTYRDICKIIEKNKIDILHVHNTVALVSPAAYIAGINMGIPVVQTVHNMRLVCPNGVCYVKDHVCENCLKYGLKASLVHNCYRGSKIQTAVMALTMHLQRLIRTYSYLNYICLTEFNKEKLMTIKQVRPNRIFIKPNFTKQEHELVPYSLRKKQIVYAGRLEKKKGVELLLQAWMKLGDKAPKLIICGTGDIEEWCYEYIENNELKSVQLLGQVPNDEVKRLIGESMAMIHPTQLYEGFPMTIAESYSMGTPIIASDIGNVGSLVIEGVTGVKFKSNSVVDMAKAVERFMDNPVELPPEYLTMYSEDNNYNMLKNIYESVRRAN